MYSRVTSIESQHATAQRPLTGVDSKVRRSPRCTERRKSPRFGGAADAVDADTSLSMDGKENHGGLEHTQYEARESHKAGLAQRSQNQLNQNHSQRRGRAPGKSRRGYHNQKRHGMWPAGPQRQIAWPRNARTHPQGVHWFPTPNANTPYMMQPHRFPPQPATPSYVADTSMRYVYATPGTQLATEISAMVSCFCLSRCRRFCSCSLTASFSVAGNAYTLGKLANRDATRDRH